jgi:hypothetical protein
MFKRFIAWFASLFDRRFRPRPSSPPIGSSTGRKFIARAEQDPPGIAEAGILHLVEDDGGQYWLCMLRCPCGCGATIQLPMTPPARPCWQLRGTMQQPTLWPSVRRASGCKSHFVLRKGLVQWCRD